MFVVNLTLNRYMVNEIWDHVNIFLQNCVVRCRSIIGLSKCMSDELSV